MKRYIVISIFILIHIGCNKKNTETDNFFEEKLIVDENKGEIRGEIIGCGYNQKVSKSNIFISKPGNRELSQISSILKFSGLSSNFQVYAANIDNAIATIINNKRYILYDPKLLDYTDYMSGDYWASMSILAHEIGHHLAGHTISMKGSDPKDELEADKFSGFVLYKLGATLEQSIKAMNILGSDKASLTHPSKEKRIRAITRGWEEANATRYQGAIPPPPKDVNEYYIYTVSDLIRSEYREDPSAEFWYGEYRFLYGVITDVSKDLSTVNVRIVKSSEKFSKEFRNIKNEDWEINLDQTSWGDNTMSHAASMQLKSFLVPGRRIKFSMVEAYPGAGTISNGVWYFTYLEEFRQADF